MIFKPIALQGLTNSSLPRCFVTAALVPLVVNRKSEAAEYLSPRFAVQIISDTFVMPASITTCFISYRKSALYCQSPYLPFIGSGTSGIFHKKQQTTFGRGLIRNRYFLISFSLLHRVFFVLRKNFYFFIKSR